MENRASNLSEHQQEIADAIKDDIKAGHKRIVLKGSAGVGKTYMVNELIKQLKREEIVSKYKIIWVTAPTHKALKVIKNKVDANVEFATVHSALKLGRKVDNKTGVVSFTQFGNSSKCFANTSIVFVDESSMLNIGTEEKLGIIKYLDKYPDIIMIFIGDEKQINPVNESNSPIFNLDYRSYELLEIVRQGPGNPIINLSQNLNKATSHISELIDKVGYEFVYDRSTLISELAEVNGTDELKYLAWTNAVVDCVNFDVRATIYGIPKKVEENESLVLKSPFGTLNTNDELKIEQLEVIEKSFIVPNEKTIFSYDGELANNIYDHVKLKVYMINGLIPVIHEDTVATQSKVLNNLKAMAKMHKKWKAFYYYTSKFLDFTYNHAITVHKSQGSTYHTAIIDVENINLNKRVEERKRLLYTAITRASNLDLLFFLNRK